MERIRLEERLAVWAEANPSVFNNDEADEEDDFGFGTKKKSKYFAASRPSDILFEKHFKLQESLSANCVANVCEVLVQVFQDAHFNVSEDFLDLYSQVYENTAQGSPLRNRLALCEYENSDIVPILKRLLASPELEVIVFFRQGHTFPCIIAQIEDKLSVIDEIIKGLAYRSYAPMTFTSRVKAVAAGLASGKKHNQAMQGVYADIKANVYFDFETTLSIEEHR